MSQEGIRTPSLISYTDNEEEEVLKDCEVNNEKPNSQRRRLNKKWISSPGSVYEDEQEEENLDDFTESTSNYDDKVGKKRHRKKKDESSLKKTKTKNDSVFDMDNSAEIKEMWDSITNDNSKDGDNNVIANCAKKKEDDDDIENLFKFVKRKKKEEKNAAEIALQVENVMANLEIAVEDDVEFNKQGKPAISKLMKLPLLNEALSKKPLQAEFLDHGILNLLKSWLEPLPDGSLPNINIRAAILKILNDDLSINLDQDCRREQLINSGLGKVINFLSKSDEETTPNKRLAKDLVNKWSRIIYRKSTRYEDMLTPEEQEEQRQMLLRRQIVKTPPKLSGRLKARDFDVDIDLSPEKPQSKEEEAKRAKVPKALSMDFTIRPQPKIDKQLEARVKMQMENNVLHENIIKNRKKRKMSRKTSMQGLKLSSVNGRM